MIPNKEEAVRELEIAGKMNPGKWVEHSLNVAKVAELIANNCDSLDSERAYIFGLLHDIGRREGVFAVKHIIDGYDESQFEINKPKVEEKKSANPITGDNITLWISLALVSMVGIVGTKKLTRKKKRVSKH